MNVLARGDFWRIGVLVYVCVGVGGMPEVE